MWSLWPLGAIWEMSGKKFSRLVSGQLFMLFLPAAVICIVGAAFLFQSEIDTDRKRIRSSEMASVQVGVEAGVSSIRRELELITHDLAFLAAEDMFIDLISHESRTVYNHVSAEWVRFSIIKAIYDQIRWLDLNGQERLRVNFNDGSPAPVPEDQLQEKGKRYYFADTVKLNRGEFFISPLDLNIEGGKIEQPRKPMIRIGTPVFDLEHSPLSLIRFWGFSFAR